MSVGLRAHTGGELRRSCLAMGGLVWEGSRRLVSLQFQIHPIGKVVLAKLWAAGRGRCCFCRAKKQEIVAVCGASAMLPRSKHAALCRVWFIS